jgi:hypothetical protein
MTGALILIIDYLAKKISLLQMIDERLLCVTL